MKTRSNLSKNNDKQNRKKSPFWSFMGGEFLLKESVIRWYPFVLILSMCAIIIVQNETSIEAKEKERKELIEDYHRMMAPSRFKNSATGQDFSTEIMELAKRQGFMQKDSATFKIISSK